jgi:Bacterial Ig domain
MRQITRHLGLFLCFSLLAGCFKLPNKPPVVVLLSPINNSYTFAEETFFIKVSAKDPDGIERVEFLSDGKIIGTVRTEPYEFGYKNPPIGVRKITARAFDKKGLSNESAVVNLTVRGALDVGIEQIIQPTAAVQTTQIFPIIMLKNWGKTRVTSAVVSYTLDNAAPLLFTWAGVLEANGGQVALYLPPIRNENGFHTLTVKVEKINTRTDDDPDNNVKSRTFMSNIVNFPPSVSVTAPASRSEVFQDENFLFEAAATDRDGQIKRVDFYRGAVLLGSDSTFPYNLSRRDLPVGSYKITARAYDDRDSATTSVETTLLVKPSFDVGIVQIAAPIGVVPTVYIAPVILVKNYSNKVITACDIFYELDNSGIVHTLNWLGNIGTSIQLSINLPQIRNENGAHSLKIWLEKPNGQADGNALNNVNTTYFQSTIINSPPSVNLTAPTGTVTIRTNQPYTFKAWATDLDGTIKKVEFFRGTFLLGTDSIAPYEITHSTLPLGTHSITAVATDDRNKTTIAVATTLVVVNAFVEPNSGSNATALIAPSSSTNQVMAHAFSYLPTPSVSATEISVNQAFSLNEVLFLSPNPAQSVVNLAVKDVPTGVYTVSLMHLSGRIEQQISWTITDAATPLQLPLSARLPAGWYTVTVRNKSAMWSKKLYITR